MSRWPGWRRLWPGTLFARLTLLLLAFALAGHALALTALFELGGPPGPVVPDAPAAAVPDGRGPGPAHDTLPGPHPERPPFRPLGAVVDLGVRLSVLTLAAWIAASWITRPIKRLADATRALGLGLSTTPRPPLPDEGPRECREASQGFNRMQAQIVSHLQERDRFVAAVSHDLRTPLTRLRLRAEDLPSDSLRQAFGRDIREMDAMISATLDLFQSAAACEPLASLDIQALTERIAQDQRLLGHDVQVQGQAGEWPAAPTALQRCLVNLVDNAVRYGGSARISLQQTDTKLQVTVQDSGPGIAPAELQRVLQPFYRLEASRNRHTGGVGLGLSIAHDIARQHGGSLVLRNGPSGGLHAVLLLPARRLGMDDVVSLRGETLERTERRSVNAAVR